VGTDGSEENARGENGGRGVVTKSRSYSGELGREAAGISNCAAS